MKRSYALWIMLAILLTLWAVAVWGANADAIWVDEWWTTYYIGASPNAELTSPIGVIERVAENRVHENNPVGYYVLLHLWRGLTGESDVALRLFSALCSVLTVALIYRLGRAIGGIKVGLAAAIVLAFSAFFVNYSHELRMYALACLWGALGLLAYWQFMHRPRESFWWGAALVMSAAGLVYTHYGNTMLVILLGLYHLSVTPRDPQSSSARSWWRKDRRWWMAAMLAVSAGVLFLPHLPITLGIGNRFTEKLSTTDTISGGAWPLIDVLRMTVFGFANEQGAFLLILLVAFSVVLRLKMTPRQREGLIFTGALGLGGILTLLVLRLSFQTVFHVRYLLVTWLPLSLFAGLVLTLAVQNVRAQQWRNLFAAVLCVAWIGVGLALSLDLPYHGNYIHPTFRPAFTEPNRWDDAGEQITRESRPEDAVAISVGEELACAHRGDAEYYFKNIPARLLVLENDGVDPEGFVDFVHGASRVWLVRTADRQPSPTYQKMEAALTAEGYQLCGEPQTQGGLVITLYSVVPQCCALPDTTLATFGENAVLRYHQATMANDKLSIWQGWQINEGTPENTYSIGWYLFGPSGDVGNQLDRSLPIPGYTCLLTEIENPVSDGELRIGIYAWDGGARLPVSGENAADNLLTVPIGE